MSFIIGTVHNVHVIGLMRMKEMCHVVCM